ncbi:nucleoside triphosphate pyrophosphohydrolase [Alkalihalobacillus hemicellulosilyticus]|uniref:Possible tetrapyrrole methyltransferase domain n=1 Tax=Halalkalibacter hemicellulosilyticusJCM 9152 TaxID=1236971 RepID=W4QJD3_9BACI|nr:nucleoside triphosphate pyrophosphohydrolase [Halalkalibacter hemicellulosilyticus]GAE31753.1 possible tetrapyrrole methyltransferase domain [Halalkalibacter hemicellulosilyticusJCM 9152]
MKKVTVIGLGSGDLEQMPLGIYRYIAKHKKLLVRTKDHPAIKELEAEGIVIESFDHLYEEYDDFERVYEAIVEQLKEENGTELIYAVPGHPFVAERTVQLLKDDQDVTLHVLGGQSFLDDMYTALQIDPIEGCQIIDGTSMNRDELELTHHMIIVQVYDSYIASEVKLTLMDRLPDDYKVTIVTAAGSRNQIIKTVPLYELDRDLALSNLTAIYVPPVKNDQLLYGEFVTLRQVITKLRGPGGCPWDQKQTHASLKKYLLEEAYEVLEAIDQEDDEHLIEELGDVLLQVMLHAQIGEDEGYFSIDDVVRSLTEKMIRRHPHVFGDVKVKGSEDVVMNWDAIKQQEKGRQQPVELLLDAIPKGIPALIESKKLQKQAAKVGFDWSDAAPILVKLQEEIGEFLQEVKYERMNEMTKELGDMLFVVTNLARFYEIDAEEALLGANQKFRRRFNYIDTVTRERGLVMSNLTLEQLDEIWEEAKQLEKEGDVT